MQREGPRVSRRDLLRGRLFGRRADAVPVPAAAVRERVVAVLRPPGALDERAFLQACTRCTDCRTACPAGSIVPAAPGSLTGERTPVMDVRSHPCLFCADLPCVAACKTGALQRGRPLAVGTAFVLAQHCLTYRGEPCRACADSCPVPGTIVFMEERPRVMESLCTGCGHCARACPAPVNAVLIRPPASRLRPAG